MYFRLGMLVHRGEITKEAYLTIHMSNRNFCSIMLVKCMFGLMSLLS